MLKLITEIPTMTIINPDFFHNMKGNRNAKQSKDVKNNPAANSLIPQAVAN